MKISILLLIGLTILIIETSCVRLPIQSHSFNDLDYVANLIARGIDNYKIDVSLANRKSCQNFSTWNKSKPCIKINQYIQQVCCLALRGDTSTMISFAYPFNTSDDFQVFLDSQLAKIVSYEPNRRILFAINFQFSFSFDNSLSLKFLLGLVDIMQKYPKNLLLGTGSDSFILEYDRICYGKGAPECIDTYRKISKSNIFLQSSAMNPFDPRDYYKRYRNFNVFYKEIDNFCQHGFPAWINNHPEFPMIFWEPSSQLQVQHVLTQFLSPTCIKKHGRNISGLAIATNMDPQMLDFYMRKLIQPMTFSDWLFAYASQKQPKLLANTSWSPTAEKILLNEQVNLKLTKMTIGKSEIIFISSVNVLTNRLLLQRWQFDSKTQSMKLTLNRELGPLFSKDETIQTLLHDGMLFIILIVSNPQSWSTPNKIYYFDITTFQLINMKEWDKIQAATMKDNELIYVNCDSQYVNCTIKGAIQFRETSKYATFQINFFLSKITSIEAIDNGFILAGQSAANKYLSAAILIEKGQLLPPLMSLSLGQNPKIFKKKFGKQYGVLLSDAMCHCAVLLNNNGFNKCTFFNEPEFQSMRNVRGLVNLLQFNLQDLRKNQAIVSPCHSKLFLSKVMNGVNSDIIQLPILGQYLIGAEYLRIEDQDLMTSLFCGGSNFDKAYKYKQRSSIIGGLYLPHRSWTNTSNQLQILVQ